MHYLNVNRKPVGSTIIMYTFHITLFLLRFHSLSSEFSSDSTISPFKPFARLSDLFRLNLTYVMEMNFKPVIENYMLTINWKII